MRSIRSGKEDHAILTFNSAYKELKEAIKRGAELAQVLTETRLHDISRAREALGVVWPFLKEEPDLTEEGREHAEKLEDLMARETFFRQLPSIDQHASALEQEHKRRHKEAAQARAASYEEAAKKLKATPGWGQLGEDQQHRVSGPLVSRANTDGTASMTIPLLRSDLAACSGRLSTAVGGDASTGRRQPDRLCCGVDLLQRRHRDRRAARPGPFWSEGAMPGAHRRRQ